MKQTLDNIITWFFAVIVIWLSFIPAAANNRYESIIYLIMGLFLALSFLSAKKKGYFTGGEFDKFIWLFLIWNLISAIFAYDRHAAFQRLPGLAIPFIALYFISKNELNEKRVRLIIEVLFFSAVIVSFIGIQEFVYQKNIIYEKFVPNRFYYLSIIWSRVISTMMHPTILGTYIACCLPSAYFILEKSEKSLKRIYGLLGLIFMLIALMLTFSRTGWVTAMLITIFYFYKKNKKVLYFIIISIFLFIFLSIITANSNILTKRKVHHKLLAYSLIEGHRVKRYPLTMKMLKDQPLTGVGLNNYRLVFDKYYGKDSADVPYDIKIPDNMYLMIAGETGIMGIGIFMALLFFIIKRGIILLKEKASKNRDIVLVLFTSLIGVLIHMTSYDLFYWTAPYYLFILFLGGVAAYSRQAA